MEHTQEENLQFLQATCGRIEKEVMANPDLDTKYYAKRIAESRMCIQSALDELEEPVHDSDEFIDQVIEEQRKTVGDLLKKMEGWCETILPPPMEDEFMRLEGITEPPDTLRSAEPDTIPNESYERVKA